MIEGWFDGAAWPNPGHGAYGAIVKRDGVIIHSVSEYSGPNVSNNCTEYQGLSAVLKFLLAENIHEATIYGDADMIVKQMNGVWKAGRLSKAELKGKIPIKPRLYLPYYHEAKALRDQLPKVRIVWIPREQNSEADALSTAPLSAKGISPPEYRPFAPKREIINGRNVKISKKRRAKLQEIVEQQWRDKQERNLLFDHAISE